MLKIVRNPSLAALAAAIVMAGCSKAPETAPAAPVAPAPAVAKAAAPTATGAHADAGIAWKIASNDTDVDAAFALARAEAKPVFVYWGAKWCPPCNQVKATLFNRVDFIERSRAFVPVYVDGDSPGAQKLGARFKVSGYPTMVLFSAAGTELTRLPGEVDPQAYTEVLTLGMNARRPAKEVLAQVRAGGQGLTASDWRLLAFYSWDTDHQQLVPKGGVPALMKELAAACPTDQPETRTRLQLKALAAVDEKAPAKPDPVAQAALLKLLADPVAARGHTDVLTNYATDITRALSARGTKQRSALVQGFEAALVRFEGDATLSRADRMQALAARVELARIDAPKNPPKNAPVKLPPALLADVREQTARADREITDGYERQAVITSAAGLLEYAGLGTESDTLLMANLSRSHSPYYLMSELASNAKKRGDKAEALRWYEQAFDTSEGPATRLQWGASYVSALVELAPHDDARIERAVAQLFAEASKMPDAFYERSGRAMQRVGSQLHAWNKSGQHDSALQRLQAQLEGVCAAINKADPHRASCDGLLKARVKA